MESVNEFYLWIKSSDSLNYYPDNVSNKFRVRLAARLDFKLTDWLVALREIHIPKIAEPGKEQDFYLVCSSICGQTLVGDRSLRLLRKIKVEKETYIAEFIHGNYIPVNRSEVESIDIRILSERGTYFNFVSGTDTHCLFHFKKKYL